MDRIFVRNFVLFVVFLLVCASSLSYGLIEGDRQIQKTDELLTHTHDIINEAQLLATLVEGIIAAQRGYLLTKKEIFLREYEEKKIDVSERIARLSELTADKPSQQSRLNDIRNYFHDFAKSLEDRSKSSIDFPKTDILDDVSTVNNIKNDILRINSVVLEEAYSALNENVAAVESTKSKYFKTLLYGVILGTVLLLIFNFFLLKVQRKRTRAEASLKSSEERFALAIDGTQDGVFDWNIQKNEVFYSKRFFSMLGYKREAFKGTTEDFSSLLHPDDKEKAWKVVDDYLKGKSNEYSQTFRMKHKKGHWVWVQSRAKVLKNQDGQAWRMVGAHTDITAMMDAQEKLEAEKEAAQAANLAKGEFLAHMSHEIRTPLTAVTGIAEILESKQNGFDDRIQKLIRTLVSSTSSLKDLINDILDFSRIEGGRLELDKHNFYLDELFESVISMMSVRANENGIDFTFDYEDVREEKFYGDSVRLRQVLVNLIGNALKFTEKGSVTVIATVCDDEGAEVLQIDVIDTGIGIDVENQEMIFKRFIQADSSVSRKYGGTGLGLPISRNLASLMGGKIDLESEIGKGSKFTLKIPYTVFEKSKKRKKKPKKTQKLDDRIKKAVSDETRILVAEDYEGNIVLLSYIFDDLGLVYDIAKTGKEAVNKWKNKEYDLILMDIQMPEMDGFAATETIRALEEAQNRTRTPIISMTAHALIEDKQKCIDAGMDAYIPKPIVEADLKKEIFKFMNKPVDLEGRTKLSMVK